MLSNAERKLCDSLQIDTALIGAIRSRNSNEIRPFQYSLSKIFENGVMRYDDPIFRPGLVFPEQNAKSYPLVFALKDSFKKKGYRIFVLENNFDIGKEPDRIGVLKTADQFEVLKQVGTDGINYGITNDSLVAIMRKFDRKYWLDLVGASGDWCEFMIQSEPGSWLEFAKEVYAVCPDVVDQGTETVEALAEHLQASKRLYFWWD